MTAFRELEPLFFLDRPQYQHLRAKERQRVRGAVLAVDGAVVESVAIHEGGEEVAFTAVNVACPELAPLALPNAAQSRFECDVVLDPERTCEIFAVRANGDRERMFVLDPVIDRAALASLADRVMAMPMPSGDLVATTQGGSDTTSYAESAVSGFLTLGAMLRRCGHDPAGVESVLDIGCGTGRLLLGWHADRPARRLAGADINESLIAWNRRELAGVAEWLASQVLPPLPFADATFDVIQLASVFTHLPLEYQRRWLDELLRLLRPDGSVIITLHGDVYARILLDPDSRARFATNGYVEVAGDTPGANAFSTFHSHAFATSLFDAFPYRRQFVRGNDPERPSLFPIAALQDAWVLRKAQPKIEA